MNKKIVALLVLATSSNAYSEDNTAEEIRRLTGRIEVLEREVAELKKSLRGENKLETAKNYITQKKYEEAVTLLADMYRASPNGAAAAEMLYLLASCFKKLKKLDQANTILEKLAGEYTGEFADRAKQELKTNKQEHPEQESKNNKQEHPEQESKNNKQEHPEQELKNNKQKERRDNKQRNNKQVSV